MRRGNNVRFSGELGKHNDNNGQPCAGREFEPTSLGVGGAHANEVRCLSCGRELIAYEDRLSAA
ncbi:MAG TPA: hypothetical protein VH437_12595 [Terriglobales bacterium]|jgi:hypothetical protein